MNSLMISLLLAKHRQSVVVLDNLVAAYWNWESRLGQSQTPTRNHRKATESVL